MLKLYKGIFIIFALLFLGFIPLHAQHGQEDAHATDSHSADAQGEKKFNAGEYILEHRASSS